MALIGDRERERAAALLKKHYMQGRLSVAELTERLEVALTARRESEVQQALAELPQAWREQTTGVRYGLETMWREARRTAFAVAVWALWWAASLVLLIGFVASVALQGLSLVNAIAFPALWLVCTFVARRVARRGRGARG